MRQSPCTSARHGRGRLCAAAVRSGAVVLALGVLPAAAADDAAERQRIAAERRAVEAVYEAARADCARRFAVTACLDAAREQRRAALAPLRERELQLDAAVRAQRAEQRLQAIERKQQELAAQQRADEARAAAAAAAAAARAPAATPAPVIARIEAPASAPQPAAPAAAAEVAARERAAERARERQAEREAAQAEARRRAALAREREAQARQAQERVEQRQAEREARGRNPAPLPVPPAASGPGAR